jgi:hypothetical protein
MGWTYWLACGRQKFVGKNLGNLMGIRKCSDDNIEIKHMVNVAQDRVQWQALLLAMLNLQVLLPEN